MDFYRAFKKVTGMSKFLSVRCKLNSFACYVMDYGFKVFWGKRTDIESLNILDICKKLQDIKSDLIDDIFQLKGINIFVPDFPVDYIQSHLVLQKTFYEENSLKDLDEYLDSESVVLDVGANIGNHTLYWATQTKVKKVYSVEAYDKTYVKLVRNIQINNLENRVSAFNFGVSDIESKGSVSHLESTNTGATQITADSNGDVNLKLLDSLNIIEQRVDLIKIDVEGMELKCLRGAVNILQRFKPNLFVESAQLSEVDRFLQQYGYKYIKTFCGGNHFFQYSK